MKAQDVRGLAEEELSRKLGEMREELFNLRFQATTEPIDDPGRVRALRRDIARVHTVKREREIAAARGAGQGSEGTK